MNKKLYGIYIKPYSYSDEEYLYCKFFTNLDKAEAKEFELDNNTYPKPERTRIVIIDSAILEKHKIIR